MRRPASHGDAGPSVRNMFPVNAVLPERSRASTGFGGSHGASGSTVPFVYVDAELVGV